MSANGGVTNAPRDATRGTDFYAQVFQVLKIQGCPH
jgi:hypothetical protein